MHSKGVDTESFRLASRAPAELIREIQGALEAIYPRQEARAIARRLAEHCIGKPYHQLLLDHSTPLAEPTLSIVSDALERLLHNEPLQYVLGESEFCGLTLLVTPAVLIPRPETEQLAVALQKLYGAFDKLVQKCLTNDISETCCKTDEMQGTECEGEGSVLIVHDRTLSAKVTPQFAVLQRSLYRGYAVRVMDMCTGSGAIALALAAALPAAKVEACDVSAAALEVARENAARCGANVHFFAMDVLSAQTVWPSDAWDLLVCNPPYVPESRAAELSPNVTRYEPSGALYVPTEDPLIFYRTILQRGEKSLREGGMMAFEIDSEYAGALLHLAYAEGYAAAKIANDLAGKPRFLFAAREADSACVEACKAIVEEY